MREPQLPLKVPNFWIGSRKGIYLIFKALRQIVYYRKALKEKRKKEVPEKALLSTGYFSKIHRCC